MGNFAPQKPQIGRIGQRAGHARRPARWPAWPARRPIRSSRGPRVGSACVDRGQSPLTYLFYLRCADGLSARSVVTLTVTITIVKE